MLSLVEKCEQCLTGEDAFLMRIHLFSSLLLLRYRLVGGVQPWPRRLRLGSFHYMTGLSWLTLSLRTAHNGQRGFQGARVDSFPGVVPITLCVPRASRTGLLVLLLGPSP